MYMVCLLQKKPLQQQKHQMQYLWVLLAEMQKHHPGTSSNHPNGRRPDFWAIRKALNLFANLRPAYLYNELKDAGPLEEQIDRGRI